MSKTGGILIAVFLSLTGYAQDFQSEFQTHLSLGDTLKQLETLTDWEDSTPKDSELFTSYFNYHFFKAKKEVLSLVTEQPEGESIALKDSNNQTAGFLGSEIYYEEKEVKQAFSKIDQGIKLYPNRLDMRFGKIYALGQVENWNVFTKEIIKTIKKSSKNNNQWTWTNNEPKDDGELFFLNALQNYQMLLYNTMDDKLLPHMRKIGHRILKHYPEHVESLSNISITYMINEKYDKAIVYLLKAEDIDDKDYIILSNLAYSYRMKNEDKKAIEYYEKTIKYGNEQAKQYAQEQLEILKQN